MRERVDVSKSIDGVVVAAQLLLAAGHKFYAMKALPIASVDRVEHSRTTISFARCHTRQLTSLHPYQNSPSIASVYQAAAQLQR